MNPKNMILAAAAMAAGLLLAHAQTNQAPAAGNPAAATHSMAVTAPQELKWTPMVLPGADMAVISGDPGKAGELFVIRVRTADGTKVPPHWHPQDEHITVLQGTFYLGMGEKFDARALKPMAPGTFAYMPKEMRHFAWCKGETIVQVHGMGPFVVNWVNPADVPAQAPASVKKK